jgi:hypothetical protein
MIWLSYVENSENGEDREGGLLGYKDGDGGVGMRLCGGLISMMGPGGWDGCVLGGS